ncbi:MAG TPA: phosphoglycerate mutase family protein [Lysobacter sp.]|nr:phosphoglycerate mutase family protein [Lysobacter sp.]
MPIRRCLLALFCLALAACATPSAREPAATTVLLVRHAEKATGEDPMLSEVGRARATRLAVLLQGRALAAIHTTGYRRTRETAQAVASAHGLAPREYDARLPADAFATQLREAHRGQTVLVVGHSNTVPAIAAALCRCTVPPMDEHEYDRLIEVHLDAAGTPRLRESRY